MFSIASGTALLTTQFTALSTLVAYTLGIIVAATFGLMGVGFGVRYVKKYITGKKM